MGNGERKIAYFSMEIGIDPDIPTYSGGLGVLAGDTIRAASDLRVPMVGVTLLHRNGYFFQRLDDSGRQFEEPVHWPVDDFLEEQSTRVTVDLEGRSVLVRAWRYDVKRADFIVPVFFLDTDLPQNSEPDRRLTDYLYGGDERYRLCQEAILGIGGVRILRALGYQHFDRYHMNEGHAALLTLELLQEVRQAAGRASVEASDLDAVREQCVFTTHTPVSAGHDQFPRDLAESILGHQDICELMNQVCLKGRLNLTYLALHLSDYINGVAKRHRETTQLMFAEYQIDSITNGVHAATWVCNPFAELYDQHIAGWREDNSSFRYALSIEESEIWSTHLKAKHELVELVNRQANTGFDAHIFTIGFARRATSYKRACLILEDPARLRKIASEIGRLQIVFAGKAHPQDQDGKGIIQRIVKAASEFVDVLPIAYLPNYDMQMARALTSGVDLWLNTPLPPLEASGTSGMKAALNGVPSLSILDGWWVEGCVEGSTGWAIGDGSSNSDRSQDATSLYDKLERIILPMFYHDRQRYIDIMRNAIALNGSFFNTHRMIQEYAQKAYR